jgi:LysM repeat protein/soluble lytic murein transglycosylase-like protein
MSRVAAPHHTNESPAVKAIKAEETKELAALAAEQHKADAQIAALEHTAPAQKPALEQVKAKVDHQFSVERSALEAKFNHELAGARATGGGRPAAQPSGPDFHKLPSQFRQWGPDIEASAKKYHLDPAYVAAVMDRETGGKNEVGDGGHGRGLMQIDDRSHGAWLATHHQGMDPKSNIDYGCSILRVGLDAATQHGLHGDAALKFAASAYNAGLGGAEAGLRAGNSDARTTGHNYGADVLQRRSKFEAGFKAGTSAPAPHGTHGTGTHGTGTHGTGAHGTHKAKHTQHAAKPATYTVKAGDTLSGIAASHHVSLAALEHANPQIRNFNSISVGEKIHLPGGSTGGATHTGGTTHAGGTTHTGGSSASHGGSDAAFKNATSVLGRNIQDLKYSGPLAQYLDKWPSSHVCCANFVSACLQKAGQITLAEHNDSVRYLAANLHNDRKWSAVSLRDAKPGDVVCFNVPGEGPYGHVEMFAGWKNGQAQFIGSNNVNADGSQRISEGHVGYGIDVIYHYHG